MWRKVNPRALTGGRVNSTAPLENSLLVHKRSLKHGVTS